MLMELVNGAQFLNITFSLALFAAVPLTAVFWDCYSSFIMYDASL